MEIVQVKGYTLAELEPRAKERALDWLREGLDVDKWWDRVYEDAKACGKRLGLRIDDIYFSGFYHQGRGCCFSGYYSYQKGWKKAIKDYAKDDELVRIGQALQDIQRPVFYELGGDIRGEERYWRTNIDLDWHYSEYEGALDEVLRNFADWIYNNLEREYEWLTSEEQLTETAQSIGYLFNESGRVI